MEGKTRTWFCKVLNRRLNDTPDNCLSEVDVSLTQRSTWFGQSYLQSRIYISFEAMHFMHTIPHQHACPLPYSNSVVPSSNRAICITRYVSPNQDRRTCGTSLAEWWLSSLCSGSITMQNDHLGPCIKIQVTLSGTQHVSEFESHWARSKGVGLSSVKLRQPCHYLLEPSKLDWNKWYQMTYDGIPVRSDLYSTDQE